MAPGHVLTFRAVGKKANHGKPSPRGDLSGSLMIRTSSLKALIPPPRATILR